MSNTQLVVGYLCAIVITSMFVWIGVALHMAYTKLDVMLAHLKNCSAVTNRAPLKNAGPFGKFLLVGGISGIVTFPGIYLKHGGVDIEDLRNFPPCLKRKLSILQWAAWGLFTTLAALVAIGKSGSFF